MGGSIQSDSTLLDSLPLDSLHQQSIPHTTQYCILIVSKHNKTESAKNYIDSLPLKVKYFEEISLSDKEPHDRYIILQYYGDNEQSECIIWKCSQSDFLHFDKQKQDLKQTPLTKETEGVSDGGYL